MTYDESWHTFDEFKEKNFAFWKTELPNAGWKQGTCTCPQFFKIYICKHILGLAIRLKLTTPPLEAKLIPIGLKRKRGRPTKSKPALILQQLFLLVVVLFIYLDIASFIYNVS